MRKLFSVIILISLLFCGCDSLKGDEEKIDNSIQTNNAETDKLTKEQVEALYTNEGILYYIDQEGKEYVTEEFQVKDNKFKGSLVIITSKPIKRKLTFMVGYNKHNIKINGVDSYIHELNLDSGKNVFDIEVDNIKEGINVASLYITYDCNEIKEINENSEKAELGEVVVDTILLINNTNDRKNINSNENDKVNNMAYKIIGDSNEKVNGYFVTESQYKNNNIKVNNVIKAKAESDLNIPVIFSGGLLEKKNLFIVLCDGKPLEGENGYLFVWNNDEKEKLLYSNIKVKTPKEKGRHALTIIEITNPYTPYYYERKFNNSIDYILEVS